MFHVKQAPDYGNASPNVGVDKNKAMYDEKKVKKKNNSYKTIPYIQKSLFLLFN